MINVFKSFIICFSIVKLLYSHLVILRDLNLDYLHILILLFILLLKLTLSYIFVNIPQYILYNLEVIPKL